HPATNHAVEGQGIESHGGNRTESFSPERATNGKYYCVESPPALLQDIDRAAPPHRHGSPDQGVAGFAARTRGAGKTGQHPGTGADRKPRSIFAGKTGIADHRFTVVGP